MSNVVFILPFEYQPPITVILLGWSIQLSIHICAMKDHSILVSVDSLALQGIINIVPFQGAGKERKNKDYWTAGRLFTSLRGEPKASTQATAQPCSSARHSTYYRYREAEGKPSRKSGPRRR